MLPKRSITEVVKIRIKRSFIGREDQIKAFDENLRLPVDHPDRNYIFNITGQGGVGKTWLGNQFMERMKQNRMITAKIDVGVDSVLDALDQWAKQLEEQNCELKRFRERYKFYQNKRNELESDKDAPDGILNVIGGGLVKTALTLVKTTPAGPLTDFLDQEKLETGVSKGISYLYKKVTNREDRNLLQQPIPVLSELFLEDIFDIVENCQVGLWADTYEQTCSILDEWLRNIYQGEYGGVPLELLLIISGRDDLDKHGWADFQPIIMPFTLNPFSEEVARAYLYQRGITDENDIQLILKLSMRLPMLLNMLAIPGISITGDTVGATETAIARFLQWIDNSTLRELALNAALPRYINQDVIGQLAGKENAVELFNWLCKMPFVERRNEQWVYHDFVRELMLLHKRQLTLDGWIEFHGKLAAYYEAVRDRLGLEKIVGFGNNEYQKYALEAIYHRFCQSPTLYLVEVLNELTFSLSTYNDFDIKVSRTLQMGEKDCGFDEEQSWGCLLVEGFEAHYQYKDFQKTIEIYNRLLTFRGIKDKYRSLLFFWRGFCHHAAGQYEQAIADKSKAIELEPDNADYWESRGTSYHEFGQLELAIADKSKAIKLEPSNAGYWDSRGTSYHAAGQYEPAIADATKAIELDPDNASYFYSRVVSYYVAMEFEHAIADNSKAIELDPTNASYQYFRGVIYHKIRQFEQAIADKSRAIELEPTNARYYYSRGISYHAAGLYEQAIADITNAI